MSDAFLEEQILKGFLQFCPLPAHSKTEIEILNTGSFDLGTILPQKHQLLIDPIALLKYNGSCSGASGQGKTFLLTLLASSIIEKPDIGCFVFGARPEITSQLPLKKTNVTAILPSLLEYKEYMGNPKAQAVQVADILLDPWLLQYTKSAVSKELLKYYERGQSPSLVQLRNDIVKLKTTTSGLTHQQLLKLRSVLDLLILQLGSAAEITSGFRIEDYQNEKLLITLDLDHTVSALLITYYLWSIYTHNIAKNLRDKLKAVFFIDESRFFINPQRDYMVADFGEPYLSTIFSQQRSAGLSVFAFSQVGHTKLFSSNAGLKVVFNMGDARYFHDAISAMGLSRKEEDYLKRTLTPGTAVVQVYHYPKPFICKFNKPLLQKQSHKKIELLFHKEKKEVQEKDNSPKVCKRDKPARQQTLPSVQLVPGALELLKTIIEHEIISTAEAYKKARLTASLGNKAKQHLEENKLITSEAIRYYSGRGRNPRVLEQTKKGEEYAKNYYPSIKEQKLPGRGGLTHRIHAHLVAEKMKEQGYIAKTEYKEADIALTKPGESSWTAVEIVNKNSRNVRRRIISNKNAGAKHTLIITTDKESKRRYKNLVIQNAIIKDIEEFLIMRGEKSEWQG